MNSHSNTKKICILSFALILGALFLGSETAHAAATVDPAFAPVPSKAITAAGSIGQLVQPDGKVVIWGADLVVDGVSKGQIARVNVDGSVDNTFDYCGCLLSSVTNVGLQPDGKLIVAGTTGIARMVRLNANGSQDQSFGITLSGYGHNSSTAEFVEIQPDGKIYATVSGSLGSGFHSGYLVRINADSTIDSGFTTITYDNGRTIWGYVRAFALASGGKFYYAVTTYSGGSSSSVVRRINDNGTADSTWELPNFTGSGGFPGTVDVSGLSVQTDGAVVAGGRFDAVNGVSKVNFVRLMPAGNVDLTFSPPTGMASGGGQVKVLASGKILAGFNTTGIGRLARLNSDGSQDNTFVLSPTVGTVSNRWVVDSSGRIIFLGISDTPAYRYFRLNPDGDVDGTFNPNVTTFGQIYKVATQTNGKTVIAGSFSQVNGLARAGIARVNADGTPDATFDPGTGFSSIPDEVLVQTDGKVLVSGQFTTFNGTPVSSIVRLNTNGTLDGTFLPVVSNVFGMTIQTDGKILIGGSFTTINGGTKERLARLNSDGSVDATFNPQIASGGVYSITLLTDGRFIVGGAFTGVDGFNRSNLVRLNANGSLDQTFNASGIASVNEIGIQTDGKIVCTTGAGSPSGIVRRNADGSVDSTFAVPDFIYIGSSSDMYLYSLVVRPDGRIIVGGRFSTVNNISRVNLVMLKPNGSVEPTFIANGTNAVVRDMELRSDGNLIVGGDFSRIANSTRVGVARILPGLFAGQTMFDYDGDGKADVSVFRASTNQWYILRSTDFGVTQTTFAIAGDVPVPADFDGDGITDIAIYRPASGDWWSQSTINNQQINFRRFGEQPGDIPLPSDFDGDGRADYIVFRPSTNRWLRSSSVGATQSDRTFGLAGDKPVMGDFDGDGKSDVAVYRPSDGNWWWWSSLDNIQRATRWGIASDIPAPADYDGDGKTDFAVYRPSTGVWYIYNSATNSPLIGPFGLAEDKPVPADFDGDGKADIAVFRPSTGIWYLLRTTSGFTGLQFGISTDMPTQNVFLR